MNFVKKSLMDKLCIKIAHRRSCCMRNGATRILFGEAAFKLSTRHIPRRGENNAFERMDQTLSDPEKFEAVKDPHAWKADFTVSRYPRVREMASGSSLMDSGKH